MKKRAIGSGNHKFQQQSLKEWRLMSTRNGEDKVHIPPQSNQLT